MKFECKHCGQCCKRFGLGEKNFLPIFEWEAREFEVQAKKKGILVDVKPNRMFFEEINRKIVILGYGLYSSPCPFLTKDNDCSVYEKRPIICRRFPINNLPWTQSNNELSHTFFQCPTFDNVKNFTECVDNKVGMANTKVDEFFMDTYGHECFDFALKGDEIVQFMNTQIQLCLKKGFVFRNATKEELAKYERISFFDFLVDVKMIDGKARDGLIAVLSNKGSLEQFREQLAAIGQ